MHILFVYNSFFSFKLMKAISSTFHFGISYFGSLYDADPRLAPSEYAPESRDALKPSGATARRRCVFIIKALLWIPEWILVMVEMI